mgnify:CR=1 FL=1
MVVLNIMFPLYLKIFVYLNLFGIIIIGLYLLLSKKKGEQMPENFKKIYVIKNNPRM